MTTTMTTMKMTILVRLGVLQMLKCSPISMIPIIIVASQKNRPTITGMIRTSSSSTTNNIHTITIIRRNTRLIIVQVVKSSSRLTHHTSIIQIDECRPTANIKPKCNSTANTPQIITISAATVITTIIGIHQMMGLHHR